MKSKARTTMLAVRVISERGLLIRFFQPTFACTEAFYLHIGLVDHVNCCSQAISLVYHATKQGTRLERRELGEAQLRHDVRILGAEALIVFSCPPCGTSGIDQTTLVLFATSPTIQGSNGAELLKMRKEPCLLSLVLMCALMAACGGISSNRCVVTTAIAPVNATADHSATAPGNDVQFSLSSTVKGNCPLIPDSIGVWSTSDPVNTTISNQALTQGLATCLNATSTPATISNSGTVRTKTYPTASLVCK